MANSLYITATEARSGKSAIALGMMRLVTGRVRRSAPSSTVSIRPGQIMILSC